MKKGELLEGNVVRVDYPGKGIVETPEGVCVVKNVLPGQRVRVRVTKKRRGKAEGTLQEVLEETSVRRKAPCPHFGTCGGCMYLDLPFEEELSLKCSQVRRLLEDAMSKAAQLSGIPEESLDVSGWFEGILPSPREYAYRNKMEFTFGDAYKDGPLELGMHRRGGFYDIVTVDGCRIVDQDFSLILRAALDYFRNAPEGSIPPIETPGAEADPIMETPDAETSLSAVESRAEAEPPSENVCAETNQSTVTSGAEADPSMETPGAEADPIMGTPDAEASLSAEESGAETRERKGFPFYHRLRHTGYLRHLLVRKAAFTGEILVDLVTTTQMRPDLSGFTQALLGLERDGLLQGRFAGILHTDNDSQADIVADQGTEILYGKDFFTEELLGLRFKVTPFSFFQTNSHGAEVLYETARRYLTGIGMKGGTVYDLYCGTGTIAQLMAPYVDKVIGVEIVEEAVEAAKENARRNGLDNCSFLAGDVLRVLDTIEEKPDTIILDPPRDGIHPKALPKILAYGVENILYISCKPTSLARDLPAFIASGYHPVRAVCVDQFPWTSSVETIVLLSRQNLREKEQIEVKMDMEE